MRSRKKPRQARRRERTANPKAEAFGVGRMDMTLGVAATTPNERRKRMLRWMASGEKLMSSSVCGFCWQVRVAHSSCLSDRAYR